jgi:hypothetical protein
MTDERHRWRYGLWAVVLAVGGILAAFVFASLRYDTAADVSTALAAITGTLGTILGHYLGVQTGASGKEEAERARQDAERARQDAERRATEFAAVLDPDRAERVLRRLNESPEAEEPGGRNTAGR